MPTAENCDDFRTIARQLYGIVRNAQYLERRRIHQAMVCCWDSGLAGRILPLEESLEKRADGGFDGRFFCYY